MNTIEEGQRFFDSLDEYNLVRIKIDIFLLLDYQSLHIARRVSKGWRDFIDQEIWFVRKSHAMRLIAKEWRENVPTQRFLYCPNNVRDITVDNRIVLAKTIKKSWIIDITSGKTVGVLDGISALDDSIIHTSKDISSKFIAIGMGHGSCQGQVVIWDRSMSVVPSTFSLCSVQLPGYKKIKNKTLSEYIESERRSNIDYVRCVKIVGDFIIAGGYDGTLAAFSTRTFTQDVAPNQDILLGWWGMGVWNFSDLEKIEDTLVKKMDGCIRFMEKDSHWLLVISDRECALLDFSRGLFPNMDTKIDGVSPGDVSDCSLKYPHAFFALTNASKEAKCVEIWNIEKNQKIREILNSGTWQGSFVAVNENIFAAKMSESEVWSLESGAIMMKVFLHDIEELVNPNIATDDLWMGTVTYPVDIENGSINNYRIAMNTKSLFVISGYRDRVDRDIGYIGYDAEDPDFKKIYVWDFIKKENDFDKCHGKTEGRKSILKRIKSWTRRMK